VIRLIKAHGERERESMPWRPVTGQAVLARLDGQVREVLVTAWESISGSVKVAWPPQNTALVPGHRFSKMRTVEIARARYEPLDPDAFKAATSG
jgi:hypothetical protein